MVNISTDVLSKYNSILAKKSIPISYQDGYKKWLKYYLDFCNKYGFSHSNRESLTQFIKKLQEKHQTQMQQKEDAHAISFYYEILQVGINTKAGSNIISDTKSNLGSETIKKSPSSSQLQVHEEAGIENDSITAEWKKAYADMSVEIKIRGWFIFIVFPMISFGFHVIYLSSF
ncbi:MAG: hypothetical protein QME49_07025 [bacterium]|nr:hypothetical protein [bacterium]